MVTLTSRIGYDGVQLPSPSGQVGQVGPGRAGGLRSPNNLAHASRRIPHSHFASHRISARVVSHGDGDGSPRFQGASEVRDLV